MTKKTLIVFILLFSASYNSFGQSVKDSLSQVLNTSLPDTSRVKTYLQFFYTDLYYDSLNVVIEYTHKALSLSNKIGFSKGQADAQNSLGYIYRIQSENDSAFYYFNEALKAAEPVNYTTGLLDAYIGLGNTNNQISNWEEAIGQFRQAEEIAIKANNNRIAASANNNMGNISLAQGALTDALTYYQKAAEIGPPSIKEVSLINIALVHIELGNNEKARSYLIEAEKMVQVSNNRYAMAFVYQHLGSLEKSGKRFEAAIGYYEKAMESYNMIDERFNYSEVLTSVAGVYFDQKEYIKALEAYTESKSIQEEIEHYTGLCNSLHGIGLTQLQLGNFETSEEALLRADKIASERELLTVRDDVTLTLSQLYKKTRSFEKALAYHEIHKQLSDSLLNQENSKQIMEMETRYATRQKQQEIDLLSAENKIATLQIQKQQNLRNYLILGSVLLVILVFVLLNRYKYKTKANSRLKELDQLKTTFFTNISHEFRTPLSLILSPLQKQLKENQSAETQKDLSMIHKNAMRLLELINQLLDLSKLEAGKLSLQVKQGNLKEFIGILVSSFESLAIAQKIDFKYDINDAPESAFFDGDKIQKIITNLLSNAFKFTSSGGIIILKIQHSGTSVKVVVEDTGPGIEPDELKKIFQRFHQSNTTNTHTAGTGIGLALTKELATLHHGKIEVQSNKGEGSTFTLQFPINKAAYASFEIASQPGQQPAETFLTIPNDHAPSEPEVMSSDKPVILIVEDNADLRGIIHKLLKEEYHIMESINGREGIKMAVSVMPDIIISDLMMPEVDGLALCDTLKNDEKTSHIPIILLTAKADRDTKLHGLRTGADDYLTKPFDNDELLARVKNLIDQREKLRSKYMDILMISPSKINITSPDELFIKRALQLVEDHISDSEFTIEDFQAEIGMSRMQLHRKLKALTNLSASEFVRDLRLQRAARLLSLNGTTVADAAYSCGFNSMSYFAQCFKEKYGVSPSKYEEEVG